MEGLLRSRACLVPARRRAVLAAAQSKVGDVFARTEVDAPCASAVSGVRPCSRSSHDVLRLCVLAFDGALASAVVRSPRCSSTRNCGLDTLKAAPAHSKGCTSAGRMAYASASRFESTVAGGRSRRPRYIGISVGTWLTTQNRTAKSTSGTRDLTGYPTRWLPWCSSATTGAETPGPTLRARAAPRASRSASVRVHRAAASSRRWARDS